HQRCSFSGFQIRWAHRLEVYVPISCVLLRKASELNLSPHVFTKSLHRWFHFPARDRRADARRRPRGQSANRIERNAISRSHSGFRRAHHSQPNKSDRENLERSEKTA